MHFCFLYSLSVLVAAAPFDDQIWVITRRPHAPSRTALFYGAQRRLSEDTDMIATCQKMLVSNGNAAWEADCYAKCVFYGTSPGSAWCPNAVDAASLADCVIAHTPGQCHLQNSTGTLPPSETAAAALQPPVRKLRESDSDSSNDADTDEHSDSSSDDEPKSKIDVCKDMVHSPSNWAWNVDCKKKCVYYGSPAGSPWCPTSDTGADLAACVLRLHPDQCQLVAPQRHLAAARRHSDSDDDLAAASKKMVKQCERVVASNSGRRWAEACQDWCEYYASTAGKAWCGTLTDSNDLAQCVVNFHPACVLKDQVSTTSTTRRPSHHQSDSDDDEPPSNIDICKGLVYSSSNWVWNADCKKKCVYYASPMGAPTCGNKIQNGVELAQCVLAQHPSQCQMKFVA